MNTFDQQLLRLKTSAGLTADQDIAALLGMTKAAFSERKRRGVFPEDKLWALATKRPDLQIDVAYVLNGQTARDTATAMLANFGSRLREVRGSRSLEDFAPLLGATAETVALLEANLRKPTQKQAASLVKNHPDKSAAWLLGGEAPALGAPLDQLETVLVENYRHCDPPRQVALREQAALFRAQNGQTGRKTAK